jgi:glutathione synthase
MLLKLVVLMDPIDAINIKKDSSFAMLIEAQARGYELYYMQQNDLVLSENRIKVHVQKLRVAENPDRWYELDEKVTCDIDDFDVLLMRKDPPFDMEFIYSTYLLQLAEEQGVLVVNNPQSIRDCNEKLFTAWFPDCCTPMLVSRNEQDFKEFLTENGDIILKPLDGMGGSSIFRLKQNDPNISVIIETLTQYGKQTAMAQKFIPEIRDGDKRILMVDGEAVPYSLARIPAKGETRGNLAAGGTGRAQPLSENDHKIAKQVGPILKRKGLMFVGLDVIGSYLTEINVTSPTCIREIDAAYQTNIAGLLMDAIEAKLGKTKVHK